MTLTTQTSESARGTDLYLAVQQFYARQMRALDEGRIDEWASTFTETGVFAANVHPEPTVGRALIREAARRAHQQLVADGVVRRHWLGMLEVSPGADGTVLTRTYALIVNTPKGGQAAVRLSCSCDDLLVWQDGGLLVQHRQVHRDDLA